MLVNLDIKSFYYSVDFDFDTLPVMLNNDSRIEEFSFLSEIVKRIYQKYTTVLKNYKKGISLRKPTNVILPIGLISSMVLRELYLKELDNKMKKISLYYGRYVDDMLLVINASHFKVYSTDDFIQKFFVDTNLIKRISTSNDMFSFTDFPNLKLQNSKISCIFFEQSDKEDILVQLYEEKIRVNTSEINLIPDIDSIQVSSFNANAYEIDYVSKTNKIRDFQFLSSNNYRAILRIREITRFVKNITITDDFLDAQMEEILDFYSGSRSIENINVWVAIFELFVISKKKQFANNFFEHISYTLKQLNFEHLDNDEVFKNKHSQVLKKLKKNVLEHLDTSVSIGISLDYSIGKKKRHKLLARKIRSANMFNQNLISFPLTNYTKQSEVYFESVINSDIQYYFPLTTHDIIELDEFKLQYSPRYIHLDELHLYLFSQAIFTAGSIQRLKVDTIYNQYLKINSLANYSNNPISDDEIFFLQDVNVRLRKITLPFKTKDKIKIGLVNTKLEESTPLDGVMNPNILTHPNLKQKLYSVLETAIKEKADYVVFPEFYMPWAWLGDMLSFSRTNKIAIITGMQYFVNQKKVHNMVSTIVPSSANSTFTTTFPVIREKNYYAPFEKVEVSKMGFICTDKKTPLYNIISHGDVDFSVILCFEFTDIFSRSSLKSKINTLFVPQFNMDTNYFSSIVESAARDLHAYVIQSNTSKYGDSRITSPSKTELKNIVQIKGGENDTIIIGEIDINALQEYRNAYPANLKKGIRKCYNCKKVINKTFKEKQSVCKHCKHSIPKGKFKNVPPNF